MKVRVASAGTGKTTSLVARYLELLGEGIPLRRIAGATFTRAAAVELRQRVGDGISQLLDTGDYHGLVSLQPGGRQHYETARLELPGATLSTIHGFMIRLLRLNAPARSLDPEFSMLDELEATLMFEEELNAVLQHEGGDAGLAAAAMTLFARRSQASSFSGDVRLLGPWTQALERYRQRLAGTRLGPADIELEALALLQDPGARRRIASRVSHLLVDEYQDVNPLQGEFFAGLERYAGVNVEVVGDPKQSIYAFRDADVEVFRAALASGTALPPLTETRRHSRAVAGFLNRLTAAMAAEGLGFSPDEAVPVSPAGPQAGVEGSVEFHLVEGNAELSTLRRYEATVLAGLLKEEGGPWRDIAVLARSVASLNLVRAALTEAGIPVIMAAGQGFYARREIRDVAVAFRAALNPAGNALAALLRSPWAGMTLTDIQQVMLAEEPLDVLPAAVRATVDRLRELVLLPPAAALRALLRENLAQGRRLADHGGQRERDNLDALLLRVQARPPASLETLLAEIDRFERARIPEVPQSGDGVTLQTVHGSKGLEWPVVVWFDAGGGQRPASGSLFLGPGGRVHLEGEDDFATAREAQSHRERQETYRLHYVAASRPRDRLIITGSRGKRKSRFLELLTQTVEPKVHPLDPAGLVQDGAYVILPPPRQEAVWTRMRFRTGRLPPVAGPSSAADEPVLNVDGEGLVPGRQAAIGTLVHQGISLDQVPDVTALTGQDVMFPFSPEERLAMAHEARTLLASYRRMLGSQLPALADREVDEAELPFAFPRGGTIWQGRIDRLYLSGGEWYVDDYKTGRPGEPEQHHVQLGLYLLAVRAFRGVEPRARLVYVRTGDVVEPGNDVLLAAAAALG